jgi:hypothetical protein
MLTLVKPTFLLALLVCDWAGDPYQGRSPLSRPLASQEAFCHSLAYRGETLRSTAADVLDCPAAPRDVALAPAPPEITLAGRFRPPPPPPGNLYLFMSLQR